MTRKQKLLLNTGAGILKQLIVTVCGFILPRYMLLYYGSSVNGLVSSITSFLGFISLLEMGIGPVVQANLYGPLAQKDHEQISRIIISCERFFRKIAYIFLGYLLVLTFVFPNFINTEYDAWFTVSLLVIIAISTFAQYYFGATYQLLLNADQRSYVQIGLQIVTVILNTVMSVILMQLGASVQMVKLLTAGIYILRPLGQSLYVRKHYELNKKLVLTEEPIKQKWNGFAQHLASVISENVAVVVLSFCSTLANVSIYSVYFNVTNGVTLVVMTAATGLESYFGNMIAKKEDAELLKAFKGIEWIMHTGVTIVYTIAAILIVPFITVYTDGITDANYYEPVFGVLLVLAYAAQCMRVPYFRIIKAAGHFKETQNGSFISTVLNVVVSLVLVSRFGLIGVAVGTMSAMLFHTCYLVWYLRSNILKRPARYFVGYLLTDVAIGLIAAFLTRSIMLAEVTYWAWFVMAVQVGIITVVVAVVVNLAVRWKDAFAFVKEHLRKR